MNAPSRILPGLRIDTAQIDNIIAHAVALRSHPEKGSVEWLNWLCALDVLIGNDALTSEIEDVEYDLGLTDSDCLACGQSSCGCDQGYEDALSLAYVDRISPTQVML